VKVVSTQRGQKDRLAAVSFAVLVVGSLIFDAAHGWFWQRAHDIAPVAALLALALVVALLRRSRAAWWVFVIADATSLPSFVAHAVTKHVTVGYLVGLAFWISELAILLSAPMRRYVGVGRWRSSPQPGPARA
jgi:hypothetical protein